MTRAHGESKASKSDAKKDKRAANKQDEDDLDALLKEFRDMQATQTTVKEEAVPPPSPRANATLTAHPTKDELLLFGGDLKVKHAQQTIAMDKWIEFEAAPRVGVLFVQLRQELDKLLLQKLANPSLEIEHAGRTVDTIVQLLQEEEGIMQAQDA